VGDVEVVGEPAGPAGGFEDQPEVQGLAGVDYVEDAVGFEVADAVADGGQVGGVVAVAAVGLADHQGGGFIVGAGDLGGQEYQGAVAFHDHTAGG
jgi:hypothetical protein